MVDESYEMTDLAWSRLILKYWFIDDANCITEVDNSRSRATGNRSSLFVDGTKPISTGSPSGSKLGLPGITSDVDTKLSIDADKMDPKKIEILMNINANRYIRDGLVDRERLRTKLERMKERRAASHKPTQILQWMQLIGPPNEAPLQDTSRTFEEADIAEDALRYLPVLSPKSKKLRELIRSQRNLPRK
jgi:hypothetical protein